MGTATVQGPEWRTNIISICYATPPPAFHCLSQLDAQAHSDGNGAQQRANDIDLYGHLFEDKEADREAMARLEAAVRVA
jgi:hypothetical protein